MNVMSKTSSTTSHPLDPLTADEIRQAARLVRNADFATDTLKFETIELAYPEKSFLRGWTAGAPFPRRAHVCAYDTADGTVYECRLDLDEDRLTGYRTVPGARTAIVIDEIVTCAENVARHPDFIAAMKKRGITDLENIQVDPFSAGNFGFEDEEDVRIAHCYVFYRNSRHDNGYAHPVEGLNVLYDLNAGKVLKVLDRTVAPVPMDAHNYAVRFEEIADNLRDDLAPIDIRQPDGPSFTVQGRQVDWLNWRFHVEFNAREGLVLNDLQFRDGDRMRPVLFRAAVAEMVVPYGDPNYGHYRKNAFDVGEYGIGRLANALKLGCDCRGHIHYFDGIVNDTTGEPVVIENAICMHEEDDGMLWKHTDYMTMEVEVRRSRRLVVSSIATVGNYEYGFYWNLYLDGTIELEVKLTGIMNTGGMNDVSGDRFGTEVAKGVLAPNHLHLFCARLDSAIDGDANSAVEVNVVQPPMGPDNPMGNAFMAEETVLATEKAARRKRNAETERYWRLINPNRRNGMGKPVGYKLMAPSMVRAFHHAETRLAKRAAFTDNHVWVTPRDPAQRYPAGQYVNQSTGDDGIGVWTEADRPVENTDIVLWHTFGIVHLPRLEDFPVQPSVKCGFALMADGFFDRNPTLNMPPSRDGGPA
ncbi:primary-amine oxidase [Minwuia sp.]|uniref:primary-amine oxidase n=1 Tax=Minwuia sp. TaxID=2493630 RepID=UPI003A8CF7EE